MSIEYDRTTTVSIEIIFRMCYQIVSNRSTPSDIVLTFNLAQSYESRNRWLMI